MKQKLVHAAIAAIVSALCATAHAAPVISLSIDGAAPIYCADGASCDGSGVAGVVHFNYSGGDFAINATTGISKPIHTTGVPLMHLDTVNLQVFGAAHSLVIRLTDTDFTLAGLFSADYSAMLSSTGAGATFSYGTQYDANNDPFGYSGAIGSVGPLGLGQYSGTFGNLFTPVGGPYSVTQIVTVTTVRDGVTNFSGNFEVNVAEPTTLALLGVGLIGFAAVRRRRR
jgi:hypothetical protein